VLKNTSCERFFHVEYRRKTIRALDSIRDVRKYYICCLHTALSSILNTSFHSRSACLTFMQKRC